MKTLALFCLTFCYSFIAFNQDTLSCKKDLTWDKEHFYYKTGDASKQKYTGPAKCFPRKGVENRGYLKNGNWEGFVYGYKEGKLIGYAFFIDGYLDGVQVVLNEEGKTKDSSVYEKRQLKYSKKINYASKTGDVSYVFEDIYGDTTTNKYYIYSNNQLEFLEERKKIKNVKNGPQIEYSVSQDENGNNIFSYDKYIYYKNGKKEFQLFYDGGYLYEGEYFDANQKLIKKVLYFGDVNKLESEEHYVNGKISGDVKHFDESGKLVSLDKYEKGKLIETIEY